ncbi:hypothetical protein D3C79_548150 [compost metagenome]
MKIVSLKNGMPSFASMPLPKVDQQKMRMPGDRITMTVKRLKKHGGMSGASNQVRPENRPTS